MSAHSAPFQERARGTASRHGWEYKELPGDTRLVDRLLAGDWSLVPSVDQDDILIVPTGMAILATFDERVVVAAAAGGL